MNIIIQNLNYAHSLNSGYRSPIAETFNGNGLLDNYIKAKYTEHKTVRLLLEQNQLQEEENAIAEQIARKVIEIFK